MDMPSSGRAASACCLKLPWCPRVRRRSSASGVPGPVTCGRVGSETERSRSKSVYESLTWTRHVRVIHVKIDRK
jgi:hypothetical protein